MLVVNYCVMLPNIGKIVINYKKYSTNVPFLNLLAIIHKEKRIFLHFSKSIEIILNCEKMSVLIEDIDVPWPTKLKPKHDIKSLIKDMIDYELDHLENDFKKF